MSCRPIIQTRQVSLCYSTPRGSIAAVAGVDLEVAAGECVVIMGRSGSGKSTLLALLGGLCRPTSGEVRFADVSWQGRSSRESSAVRARGIGLLLQDGGLLPGLRAIDNVVLPAVLAGATRSAAEARAETLLRLVGLGERWDAYAAELSGGQQRRVALARALAAEPQVLLADEPTGDLDGLAAREIATILDHLRATRSTAMVVVTHDPVVAAIGDRRLWMERGRCSVLVDDRSLAAEHSSSATQSLAPGEATVYEPAPAALMAGAPRRGDLGLARRWLPFLVGLATAAGGVALVDGVVAARQRTVVQTARARRQLAEEMALQDLRADVDDVSLDAGTTVTVTLYLQNYRPERPLHVLGPAVEIGVQRDGRWEDIPCESEMDPGGIRTLEGGKTILPVRFTLSEGGYDELLAGYMHVRIGAAMVVSGRPDGSGDLFERQDAYYVYLRDPRRSDDEIRRANAWGEQATVPVWIAMPSH